MAVPVIIDMHHQCDVRSTCVLCIEHQISKGVVIKHDGTALRQCIGRGHKEISGGEAAEIDRIAVEVVKNPERLKHRARLRVINHAMRCDARCVVVSHTRLIPIVLVLRCDVAVANTINPVEGIGIIIAIHLGRIERANTHPHVHFLTRIARIGAEEIVDVVRVPHIEAKLYLRGRIPKTRGVVVGQAADIELQHGEPAAVGAWESIDDGCSRCIGGNRIDHARGDFGRRTKIGAECDPADDVDLLLANIGISAAGVGADAGKLCICDRRQPSGCGERENETISRHD